jgi:hypothetical protein
VKLMEVPSFRSNRPRVCILESPNDYSRARLAKSARSGDLMPAKQAQSDSEDDRTMKASARKAADDSFDARNVGDAIH